MPSNVISSDSLKVFVSSKGAEVTGLFVKGKNHNWIWPAKEPWHRSAPVLFPIVGKLKNDSYIHKNKIFKLAQHGFARDSEFATEIVSENKIRYRFLGNQQTREQYPFDFSLTIDYEVVGGKLIVQYQVQNLSSEIMYFNLGWHPGFVLPHRNSSILTVSSPKGFHKKYLLENGLLNTESIVDLKDLRKTVIGPQSFSQGAWIFVDSHQREVTISNEFSDQVTIRSSAPHWGIWSSDPIQFVCIEPWWGFSDIGTASGVLSEKKGIQSLASGVEWKSSVEIEIL